MTRFVQSSQSMSLLSFRLLPPSCVRFQVLPRPVADFEPKQQQSHRQRRHTLSTLHLKRVAMEMYLVPLEHKTLSAAAAFPS